MSQEKVAKYKEAKANRKEIMKKEKRAKMVNNCLFALIPIALVAVIGLGVYSTYKDSIPRPSVDVNYTTISDFDDAMLEE